MELYFKKVLRFGFWGGGIVLYFGIFLKDFVMLDVVFKDELENGYINFDKWRKEFVVFFEL